MYADINKHTGVNTTPLEQLRMSIGDILTTPLATRLARRLYGSELPELIDAPHNGSTRVRLYAAVATALIEQEPRLQLERVRVTAEDSPEKITLTIDGYGVMSGRKYPLNAISIDL